VVRNVAAGTVSAGSTEAVNGSQLAATNAQVQANGNSIARVDQQVTANTDAIGDLQGRVNNGQVGAVRYSSATDPNTPAGAPSNDATLVGANASAPVALHNVAAGNVADGSTDAVNGSQLAATDRRAATAEAAATQAMAVGQTAVRYDGPVRNSVTLGDPSGDAVALHNVADGTSARDAVNLGQLQAASGAAVAESQAYTDSRIAGVTFDLRKVRKDSSAGTAAALALAGMPQPMEAGRGMISMGMGTFRGEQAIALGIAKALPDEHTVIKAGATYNSRGSTGANMGVGYMF
jgi:autotransporter adhesin